MDTCKESCSTLWCNPALDDDGSSQSITVTTTNLATRLNQNFGVKCDKAVFWIRHGSLREVSWVCPKGTCGSITSISWLERDHPNSTFWNEAACYETLLESTARLRFGVNFKTTWQKWKTRLGINVLFQCQTQWTNEQVDRKSVV